MCCHSRPPPTHPIVVVAFLAYVRTQCFYLTTEDKEELKAECGIEAYTFEQKLDDAVYIPAGCPHQVRNLQSCIKVALDFVSPESMPMCLTLSDEFSYFKGTGDKIQIRSIIAHSFQKTLGEVFPECSYCPEAKRRGEEPLSTAALKLEEVEKPIEKVKQSIEPNNDTMRDQTLEDATQSQHSSPQQTQTDAANIFRQFTRTTNTNLSQNN